MAGHSQFKNIMHKKGAKDAKKAKILTKVAREIISACKAGMPDPAANPRLRSAIQWAREENMTRDRIEAAIKRGSGSVDTDNFEPVRYEGYGPGGTALIIQALTDNRHRTASDIRSAFTKFGGNLGETGSVAFLFDHAGIIIYPATAASEDAMFDAALDAGANDCAFDGSRHTIACAHEHFIATRDALEKAFGAAESAKIGWQPKNTVAVNEDQARQILKLVDALEDFDDVQEVFSNFEIPEALMTALAS